MKSYTVILLLSLMLIGCKNKENKQELANKEDSAELSKNIEAVVQDYIDLGIFSGIILVAEKGNIQFHKAYGLANRETKAPNTINTLFDIGSMNKTFTSIVVKQLVAEGKLNLDDKLTQYIPGFKDPNANKITINHLLNHESGFADYHTRNYFDLPLNERKLNAIVERAKSYDLNFEPGTEQDYSNLGYVILGAVIEKVSGKSYFDNVNERIVKPLNLKNTYLNDFSGLENRIAHGYYYTPLGELDESAPLQDIPNPDGGFLSTTEDIMTFYRSYYYDDLLLSEEAKSNDSFFNYLKELPDGKATGSAGGFEGFNTALYQVVSNDFTIIVFANMDEPVAEHIALDILALTRGETPNKPQAPAIQNVREAFNKNGAEFIKANFEELTINFHPKDPKDIIINALGYAYLYEANDVDKAIKLFKLNTQLFPDIANCWDSYGEALAESGKKEEAIKAYEKALTIRPNLESAKNALKDLKK
ncbi:serine hydrolase [Xanthomarina gelatinilytica]|uniref:serine hydrolase n=1 Tax=Xanthomarina gelatinilytica TaxID=1137281 RepID=UPI002C06EE0E|nr:serine hydrolase [Vicingaceae bacterium]